MHVVGAYVTVDHVRVAPAQVAVCAGQNDVSRAVVPAVALRDDVRVVRVTVEQWTVGRAACAFCAEDVRAVAACVPADAVGHPMGHANACDACATLAAVAASVAADATDDDCDSVCHGTHLTFRRGFYSSHRRW